MLALGALVGLYRTVQLQLLWNCGWGIDLDYTNIEWFASLPKQARDLPVIFEIVPKNCILDSFVELIFIEHLLCPTHYPKSFYLYKVSYFSKPYEVCILSLTYFLKSRKLN